MSYDAEKMFVVARQLLDAGRLDEAIDRLTELAQQFPDYAPVRVRLGDFFAEQLNDLTRAEEHYQKAVASDPDSADAHAAYGALLIRTTRYAEANAHLNKAASIQGARKDVVYRLMGTLHEAQVHLDDAVSAYKKALLATFSDETLEACEKAIARCEAKRKYL